MDLNESAWQMGLTVAKKFVCSHKDVATGYVTGKVLLEVLVEVLVEALVEMPSALHSLGRV